MSDTYHWQDPTQGGDWNDPNNWATQTQPAPAGPPGPGDTVIINLTVDDTITTDGADVGSLVDLSHTPLIGDLTVTGELSQAVVQGGAVNAGQFSFSTFNGTTLSAGSISGSILNTGQVQTDEFIRGTVNGGTVSAMAIAVDDDDVVFMSGGTVNAQQLTLDGQFAELAVLGGTTTVASAANIDGPDGAAAIISVNGGRLNLRGGLTLDGGAHLNDGSADVASAGGVVTTRDLTVGETAATMVFVGGNNAHLDVTSDFILGDSGAGAITVTNGGHLMVGGNAESAVEKGSTATGMIDDAAANLDFVGDWDLGIAGKATWTLDGAVTGTVGGKTELGVSSGGSGVLTLSDVGTTLVTGGGGLIVGGEGEGTLTLQSGALLDGSNGSLTIAEAAKSKGSLQINDGGTALIVGDNATVGDAGSGTLVMDGGVATFSGTLTLGESKGATGGVAVTDAVLTIAGDMTVGDEGKGTLTIGPDGVIAPGGQSVPAGSINTITLGKQVGGKGSLTVSGVGALVESFGLVVGGAGGGSLTVGGQGKVVTTGNAGVGEAVTATIQKVTVTSGGSWTVGGNLALGEGAIATATISGGGVVEVDGVLAMGVDADATGIIVLSGGLTIGSSTTLSQLKWGRLLDVGEAGTGNLSITGGARATSLAGKQGLLEIASAKGAKGVVTLSGAGSELIGAKLAVGGDLTKAGGAGTLAIGSGGTARFAQGGVIWAGGQVSVGGLLTMGATIDNSVLTAAAGGTIRVTGGFTGTGTVAIGADGLFALNASKTDTANRVRIDSNAGTFNLAGGSANDLFQLSLAALKAADRIDGGAGSDTLQFTTAGVIAAAAFTHVSDIDVIRLAAGVNAVTIANTLVTSSDGARLTIVGGIGVNTVNAAAVSAGTLVFNGLATTQTTFTAGSGTVALTGGAGADTFSFKAANLKSQDVIVGGLGNDTLAFTTAGTIAAAAFTLVTGIDRIDLANGANALTLGNAMVQHSDADRLTILGGSGNDAVNAGAVASGATLVFDGGGGADSIVGSQGDNLYQVDKRAETLTIANGFAGGTAAHGMLQLGAGLSDQSLWLERSGDKLVIDVLGTTEQVALTGWFGTNKSAMVTEIQAGGLELDAGVSQLVSAMAAYASAHPSFNPAAAGAGMPADSMLRAALSANWHH